MQKYSSISIRKSISSTKSIKIRNNLLKRIIGNPELVKKLPLIIKQKRNLLLIGRPGIGKSMIAQTIGDLLRPTTEEIYLQKNDADAERRILRVLKRKKGNISHLDPEKLPLELQKGLNFICINCSSFSNSDLIKCPSCQSNKYLDKKKETAAPVKETPLNAMNLQNVIYSEVKTLLRALAIPEDMQKIGEAAFSVPAKEEIVENNAPKIIEVKDPSIYNSSKLKKGFYERKGKYVVFTPQEDILRNEINKTPNKFYKIIPFERKRTILYNGAGGDQELLGGVQHDRYGGHPQIGTPAYRRARPGAIHEAHEGVLFLDEISTAMKHQKMILTAMQEKKYPLGGSRGTGGLAKVEDVPCDFILVAAGNFQDIDQISARLRSRLLGYGYEFLMNDHFKINSKNTREYLQFMAQEVAKAKNIPHLNRSGILELLKYSKVRAKADGYEDSYTLLLREIGGLIRKAGDISIENNKKYIGEKEVKLAILENRSIEKKIKDVYGGLSRAISKELTESQKSKMADYYEF